MDLRAGRAPRGQWMCHKCELATLKKIKATQQSKMQCCDYTYAYAYDYDPSSSELLFVLCSGVELRPNPLIPTFFIDQ